MIVEWRLVVVLKSGRGNLDAKATVTLIQVSSSIIICYCTEYFNLKKIIENEFWITVLIVSFEFACWIKRGCGEGWHLGTYLAEKRMAWKPSAANCDENTHHRCKISRKLIQTHFGKNMTFQVWRKLPIFDSQWGHHKCEVIFHKMTHKVLLLLDDILQGVFWVQ